MADKSLVPQLEPHQFKPGETGNPHGGKKGKGSRPGGSRLVKKFLNMPSIMTPEEVAEVYARYPQLKEEGKVREKHRVVIKMLRKAIDDGDLKAAQWLWDRAFGKVAEAEPTLPAPTFVNINIVEDADVLKSDKIE